MENYFEIILKLFGMVEAERIVVRDYILEAYGVPTPNLSDCIKKQSGELYGEGE